MHYAVFFCTEQGFGIEMVQALDEPHAVDIVHAHQLDAVTEVVPAAFLEGKDRMQLLGQWMDDLDEYRATGDWPASITSPAPGPAAACSEHKQQGLLPRQPVGISADLTLAIEEQAVGLLLPPGQEPEADEADRAGRGNRCGGHGGVVCRTRPPGPDTPGHPAERLLLSPPEHPMREHHPAGRASQKSPGHQRKSCPASPPTLKAVAAAALDRNALEQFLAHVQADPALRRQVSESITADEVSLLAQDLGYPVSGSDLLRFSGRSAAGVRVTRIDHPGEYPGRYV